MDADAVHADADRAGGFAEVPPGGVDTSLLMVVLLNVVPVRDVGMTHARSIRPSSASRQHNARSWPAEPGRAGAGPSANGCRLVVHPAEPGAGLLGEAAQVGEPGAQLLLVDARGLRKGVERALEHVGRVVGLVSELLVLEPVRPLALVDFTEAGIVEPAGEPGSRVAPAGSLHALDHGADERLERLRRG